MVLKTEENPVELWSRLVLGIAKKMRDAEIENMELTGCHKSQCCIYEL